MGVLRTDADTHAVSGPAAPAGPDTRQPSLPRIGRRWIAVAAYLAAGLVLFAAYLRLSQTYGLNSDSANILLMGWDLLHGHLLLHGWYMSDVSFYPTEIPQYALLEAIFGPHMQTAHIAAAMTYTLTFLLAVLLARTGSSGRAAWIRTLIAAAIMLAPQLDLGVFALDLSVGHIGTSVPLLLVWLLLDKMAPRWYVPVLAAVLLAWVLVADPIVYVVGIAPLGLVAAARVIRGFFAEHGHWTTRIAAQWYDLSLGAATVTAAGIAWVANNVLGDLGGYSVNRLPFGLTPWGDLHNNFQARWKLLTIFGANYTGLSGAWLALAFLHVASLLVVIWALARVARRFFGMRLVDQVLAAAIVLNVVLYMVTNAADEAAHEVAIIVPFGAALAARVLIPVGGPAAQLLSKMRWPRWNGRVRLVGLTVGILVLAGYTAGFGYELTQPSEPPANTALTSWLLEHHLTYGLSGYWTSSIVTVESGERVQVRALMQYSFQPDLWMSNVQWYNAREHYANFLVYDSTPGNFSHWVPIGLTRKYFGTPAKTYHYGPYTILVWNRNLLEEIPHRVIPPISPGQLSSQVDSGGLRPVPS
jgi:hypothetical protein